MMVKKPKNVPPVTEEPKNEPDTAPQKTESAVVVPETVPPIQIPPKVLEQAKALGIDLKQVVDWAQNVEQKFAVIEKNFEQIGGFLTKMEPLIQLSERIQQQQASPQPQAPPAQGGLNIGGLLQLLPQLISGGGGDSEFAELGKKALMSQINMSNAITNAVVAKITGKATTEVAEAVTGA